MIPNSTHIIAHSSHHHSQLLQVRDGIGHFPAVSLRNRAARRYKSAVGLLSVVVASWPMLIR